LAVATVEDVEPFGLTKEQIKVLINLYEYYECLWKSNLFSTNIYLRKKPTKSKFTI